MSSQDESSQSLRPLQQLPLHRLPPEVRDMIWALTLPSNRTFEVTKIDEKDDGPDTHFFHFRYPPPSPVALRVCRESRGAALRKGFFFSTTKGLSVWFTPDTDVLYIDTFRDVLHFRITTSRIKIQGWDHVLHFEIGWRAFHEYKHQPPSPSHGLPDIMEILHAHMPNLKTISCILETHETSSGEVIEDTISLPLPGSDEDTYAVLRGRNFYQTAIELWESEITTMMYFD
ncbi:hypothetical protein HYE68_008574 [Fusarium pseudograminearum]|nr:hypothetical protein HYE68_008574 [Fusarium pseudograminearum]